MADLDSRLAGGENDRLVSMSTDRDIAIRAIATARSERQVRDIMTPDVKYCYLDQEVDEIISNMATSIASGLPVLSPRQAAWAPPVVCGDSRSATIPTLPSRLFVEFHGHQRAWPQSPARLAAPALQVPASGNPPGKNRRNLSTLCTPNPPIKTRAAPGRRRRNFPAPRLLRRIGREISDRHAPSFSTCEPTRHRKPGAGGRISRTWSPLLTMSCLPLVSVLSVTLSPAAKI